MKRRTSVKEQQGQIIIRHSSNPGTVWGRENSEDSKGGPSIPKPRPLFFHSCGADGARVPAGNG